MVPSDTVRNMGLVQLRQLEKRIRDTYLPLLDTSDVADPEMAVKTRGLAAFTVEQLSGATAVEAADSVTDGFQDNGIDALFVDAAKSTVWIVQSKWSKDGTGSTAVGDVHKFIQGFKDLVNLEFGRFNEKVNRHRIAVEAALDNPDVKFVLVIAHTGGSPLSSEAMSVVSDLLDDVNYPIETASFRSLTQADLHSFLRQDARGAQPDIKVTLHDWGHVQEPYAAFYGQVDASEIARWFDEHRGSLFDQNLREFLGQGTDINTALKETLKNSPGHFWYLNNGITALCESVAKAPAGSTAKKSGVFDFRGVSIVNGAQTVGTIGECALEDPAIVADARVMVRFISLEDCPPGFGVDVTRGTNTQNRVERRDFVALDSEQQRIREELAIDGVVYALKSGEVATEGKSFTVVDATVALACAGGDVDLAVQAKREIGRLWLGPEGGSQGSLYRRLFNRGVSGEQVWRSVQVLRKIDENIIAERSSREGRERQIGVHGNRIIAHLVFARVVGDLSGISDDDFLVKLESAGNSVSVYYSSLVDVINDEYADRYLASLFKNSTRCGELVSSVPDPDSRS